MHLALGLASAVIATVAVVAAIAGAPAAESRPPGLAVFASAAPMPVKASADRLRVVLEQVGLDAPAGETPPAVTAEAASAPAKASDKVSKARQRAAPPPPAGPRTVDWDAVAWCESRGDWSIDTGNGYTGGLQMDANFWASYGDPSYARAADAPREAQIEAAQRAYDSGRGTSPWPVCGARG